MEQVKVYLIHSSKIDYKNDLYKPLLSSGIMKNFFLILPRSEKFFSYYIKDLINDSDIIICDLTNSNLGLKIELKWAKQLNKKIFYIANKNKNTNIKVEKIYYYSNNEELINIVNSYLNSLNKKELLLEREKIYCLGNITRKKQE